MNNIKKKKIEGSGYMLPLYEDASFIATHNINKK